MIDSPAAIGMSTTNPPVAATVPTELPALEATNAATTKTGSGTTTRASHSSWRRSSPPARRQRSRSDAPEATRPAATSSTRPYSTQADAGWIAGTAQGFSMSWNGDSNGSVFTRLSRNAADAGTDDDPRRAPANVAER